MSVMMVGAWAVLILLVIWIVRQLAPGRSEGERTTRGSTALAILEERFARGEIDRQEFDERRAVLQGRSA
ncbi:MAG: SHOCT domain-containing protein [Actinomycetota bacterium]